MLEERYFRSDCMASLEIVNNAKQQGNSFEGYHIMLLGAFLLCILHFWWGTRNVACNYPIITCYLSAALRGSKTFGVSYLRSNKLGNKAASSWRSWPPNAKHNNLHIPSARDASSDFKRHEHYSSHYQGRSWVGLTIDCTLHTCK